MKKTAAFVLSLMMMISGMFACEMTYIISFAGSSEYKINAQQ